MKTVAIIQARLGSERLPGKVIQKLPFNNGKPLIKIIISQLKQLEFVDEIILATSINSENDILVELLKDADISIFRGSEENVLERFYKAAKKYKANQIIRVTGDNPIVDLESLSETYNFHIENNYDYTKGSGLPIGINTEVFSFKTLEKAYYSAKFEKEKEHVTPYMISSKKFKRGIKKFQIDAKFSKLRLTVDYPSDFAMMNLLFCALKKNTQLKDVLDLVSSNSWITDINDSNKQVTL